MMVWPFQVQAAVATNKPAIKQSSPAKFPPEQVYANLKQQLAQLTEEKGKAGVDVQLRSLAQSFYQLHQTHRKETLGAKALFMTAQVLRLKGQRFQDSGDTKLARQRYLEFADLYPGNNMADDALFEAANLPATDTEAAPSEALYAQILSQYPQGDQAIKAQKKLETKPTPPKTSVAADQVTPPTALTTPIQAQTSVSNPPKQQASDKPHVSFAAVAPMKFWATPQYSRLVVGVNEPVPYSAKKISDTQLSIELLQSTLHEKDRIRQMFEQGLLKSIQPTATEQGLVRFIIDLEPFVDYKVFALQDPFRVVVDIYGQATAPQAPVVAKPSVQESTEVTSSAEGVATSTDHAVEEIPVLIDQKKIPSTQKFASNSKSKQEQLSLAQQLGLGVRTIVIDPGHGGKDPGAMAFGLKEKDIVLKVAQKLATILKQTYQYQVVLTRTKDVFIPLEKRTAMANTHKADLFISIHVNAHADQTSSGIETYFLNLATDADAMRVAALENASSNHSIGELQDILSSLMNNSKIDESSRLARFVQSNLISGLKSTYKARDLGVKQAPFYVLIGAEMPAILAELSFITNPAEARMLQDEAHLEKLAKQLAGGIVAYIDHHHAAARLR